MFSDKVHDRSRKDSANRGGDTGPLIAASDGTVGSVSALRLTRLLAEATSSAVEIVTVLEPLPIPPVEPMLVSAPRDYDAGRRTELLAAVQEQTRAAFGDASPPVVLEEGDAAVTIARFAESRNARVLIVGLSRHGVMDRLLGGETALEILRLTDIPVLAVATGTEALPRRAIVAMDFGPSSIRAARVARSLIGEDASLVLAHVIPTEIGMVAGSPYEKGCQAAFRGVRKELGLTDDSEVESVVLHGSPAHELLTLAESMGADLIVAGREGPGDLRRVLVGSVATRLLRGATCSVLVVPESED